jgi:hypothetical protein
VGLSEKPLFAYTPTTLPFLRTSARTASTTAPTPSTPVGWPVSILDQASKPPLALKPAPAGATTNTSNAPVWETGTPVTEAVGRAAAAAAATQGAYPQAAQ